MVKMNEDDPGDSIRDLFIPDRWRSLNLAKGSLNHSKKVTKSCQDIAYHYDVPIGCTGRQHTS